MQIIVVNLNKLKKSDICLQNINPSYSNVLTAIDFFKYKRVILYTNHHFSSTSLYLEDYLTISNLESFSDASLGFKISEIVYFPKELVEIVDITVTKYKYPWYLRWCNNECEYE